MEEYFNDAREELKRVDHLIYVSLKYTRTVDVIRSIVVRLIDCFDFVINGILEKLKQQGKINEVPISSKLKCDMLLANFTDQEIIEMVEFYLLLRKFNIAKYTEHEEYRRHVTMRAKLSDGVEMDLTIDKMEEFYHKAKEIINQIESRG